MEHPQHTRGLMQMYREEQKQQITVDEINYLKFKRRFIHFI